MSDKLHPVIAAAGREMADGNMERREFLRVATLLGVSATAAYGLAGLPAPALAQGAPRKGGTVRFGMRVQDLSNPATYSWIESANTARQVVEYLTVTGIDNVTRPNLVEKWEASADLKSWTMHLRRDVKWRSGRAFTADDAMWNLKRLLDPATGSSTIGLLRAFILDSYELEVFSAEGLRGTLAFTNSGPECESTPLLVVLR